MQLSYKTILSYALVSLTTLVITYSLFYINQLRCVMVSYSSLRQVEEDIFVDPEMDDIEIQLLLMNIEQSKERVTLFFDTVTAKPKIIAGHTKKIMEKYGANMTSPGMNHITIFGNFIVLGPGGLNRDVISHEFVHSELESRIGWFNRETEIPTWFDEGLALMLDYRYSNSETIWLMLTANGKNAPSLVELDNMQGFMRYTEQSPFLSYVTASREVSRWWSIVGLKGFNEFTELIKQGEAFEKAYEIVEEKYRHPEVGR